MAKDAFCQDRMYGSEIPIKAVMELGISPAAVFVPDRSGFLRDFANP